MGFIVAPVLFVLASGLLYSTRSGRSRLSFFIALLVVIVSGVFLTAQLIRSTTHIHERHVATQQTMPGRALPQSAPAPDLSLAERITQASYQFTENALDWIVRTGTGSPGATVGSDTVVGTIIAILLAALAVAGSLLSALMRRLVGRAPVSA
ncbi:MAG TPA: hypothetical protein VG889_18115 [Rhizomicrobium sp.]|nr:hypothetical protein [Rhizomicrobium sp.]